jgi:hypothetical protein
MLDELTKTDENGEAYRLPCGHHFHHVCTDQMLEAQGEDLLGWILRRLIDAPFAALSIMRFGICQRHFSGNGLQ